MDLSFVLQKYHFCYFMFFLNMVLFLDAGDHLISARDIIEHAYIVEYDGAQRESKQRRQPIVEEKDSSAFLRNWEMQEESYAVQGYPRPQYLCTVYNASAIAIESLEHWSHYFSSRAPAYAKIAELALYNMSQAHKHLQTVMRVRADFAQALNKKIPEGIRRSIFASLEPISKLRFYWKC